jgi:hypothetical protein
VAGTALALWSFTILAGSYMFLLAMGLGRPRGTAAHSHWPTWLMVVHAGVAVGGAAVWIGYMVTREQWVAWASFVILLLVAGLGDVLFVTWFKDRRAVARAESGGEVERVPDRVPRNVPPPLVGQRMEQIDTDATVPVTEMEEGRIPAIAVYTHGALAVATIVLVLITAITA